jgi:hypothetical protein
MRNKLQKDLFRRLHNIMYRCANQCALDAVYSGHGCNLRHSRAFAFLVLRITMLPPPLLELQKVHRFLSTRMLSTAAQVTGKVERAPLPTELPLELLDLIRTRPLCTRPASTVRVAGRRPGSAVPSAMLLPVGARVLCRMRRAQHRPKALDRENSRLVGGLLESPGRLQQQSAPLKVPAHMSVRSAHWAHR